MASMNLTEDIRLNYNPEKPQRRFKTAGVKAALKPKASRLPSQVPWPAASKPTGRPLKPAPAETDDLSRFKNYDAVVVTYTSAEAAALAALFTPGYPTSAWYEYRHNVAAYIPLVTGENAPFNSKNKEDARYYHSLGLYFPCTIGRAKVLLFKSGLHLDYDGPAIPIRNLIEELVQTISPKVFITTGTGGGIGSAIALGDVAIAGLTKFFCPPLPGKDQFVDKTKFPWNADSYKTSPLPTNVLPLITPALTSVNVARIRKYNPRPIPKFWTGEANAIVTTDFFAFDDSRDTYQLQSRGIVCDMGDAMVGHVLSNYDGIQWFAIRNASDPQIPNPNNDIKAANKLSGAIYSDYGVFTTAASAIATWAVINGIINGASVPASLAIKNRSTQMKIKKTKALKKTPPRKMVALKGSVPVNNHKLLGPADATESIEVTIILRRKSEVGLPTHQAFIAGKRAKGITRQILGERYGAKREDADAVQRWAVQHSLSVSRTDLGLRQIHLVGSVAAMSRAFEVKLSMFKHWRTGTHFRCPVADIHVPEDLAPIITGVFGLNDMPVVMRRPLRDPRPKVAAQQDPLQAYPGSFYPNAVAKLYNFPPTQGAGERVAILEFGGGFDQTVLNNYFKNNIGLPTPPTVNGISVLGAPIKVDKVVTGEVYLDIEIIGAMAPKATMDVYFAPWTGQGFLVAVQQAIHNDDYAAISISYGLDEDMRDSAKNPGWPMLHQNVDEAFRDAAAIGLPVFVSTGDQGSSSVRSEIQIGGQPVDVTGYSKAAHGGYPSTSTYATAVGGTMLYAENGAISNEVVWNELGQLQRNSFYFGGATGGGVSDRYPVPSYQSKAGITPKSANDSGTTGRGVPDVSGNAGSTTGYLVSQPPGAPDPIMPVGGTSAAAPMWAALMACIRASLNLTFSGKIPVYFFNDFVYAVGKTPAFRDIVAGRTITYNQQGAVLGEFIPIGNNRSTQVNGYSAADGYDLCSGWGSPNGIELLQQLESWLKAH